MNQLCWGAVIARLACGTKRGGAAGRLAVRKARRFLAAGLVPPVRPTARGTAPRGTPGPRPPVSASTSFPPARGRDAEGDDSRGRRGPQPGPLTAAGPGERPGKSGSRRRRASRRCPARLCLAPARPGSPPRYGRGAPGPALRLGGASAGPAPPPAAEPSRRCQVSGALSGKARRRCKQCRARGAARRPTGGAGAGGGGRETGREAARAGPGGRAGAAGLPSGRCCGCGEAAAAEGAPGASRGGRPRRRRGPSF